MFARSLGVWDARRLRAEAAGVGCFEAFNRSLMSALKRGASSHTWIRSLLVKLPGGGFISVEPSFSDWDDGSGPEAQGRGRGVFWEGVFFRSFFFGPFFFGGGSLRRQGRKECREKERKEGRRKKGSKKGRKKDKKERNENPAMKEGRNARRKEGRKRGRR